MNNFPSKGDIIIVDAEPHSGREYGGYDDIGGNIRRHMVVMSNNDYNEGTGMVLAMPITPL